jgi:hypothetical protein
VTERALTRKRIIPKGALSRVREYATDGRSQGYVARALGMSEPTFRRILREDPRVAEAWAEGREDREADLMKRLSRPWDYVPAGLGSQQWQAAVRAIQHAALVELNSRFAWRVDQQAEAAKLSVEIKLPGPMSPDQYRATITGTAERVDDDA